MSDELPSVTADEAIRAFGRVGFEEVRSKGSHVTLKRPGHRYNLTIPRHGNRPLKSGLLRSLIRSAELTVKEFRELLGLPSSPAPDDQEADDDSRTAET